MDLSSYLADRTCRHVRGFVGKGSSFKEGVFQRVPEDSNAFCVFRGYELRIVDECEKISLIFEGNGINKALRDFVDLKVPGEYDKIIREVRLKSCDDSFTLELFLMPMANSQGGTQNKEKLFYAVYNAGMKPIFNAILST